MRGVRADVSRAAQVVHVCSFAEGLDFMRRADQRNPKKVLRVLHQCKRFSVFEATARPQIAKVMDWLVAEKMIEVDNSPGYPWSNVKLTAKGLRYADV